VSDCELLDMLCQTVSCWSCELCQTVSCWSCWIHGQLTLMTSGSFRWPCKIN